MEITDYHSMLRKGYSDQIFAIFAEKIKTSNHLEFEITEIKQIYNPVLLDKHRKLFYQYAEKLKKKGKGYIPKNLLCFHGTNDDRIESIFETGFDQEQVGKARSHDEGFFGKGFYVTT